ncbi:heavy metal translocating P-type ATPase [Devosia salina]|uniref:Cadmium-translocating P-type ATPase n=1 Tax=Devosia salina TaxID=2860336 RepID=A0ABX8WD47_9HYPH|nr:heavy metal translocating P-type ATPase [Devosia salina]QYO76009.1 cadmium-translocating P-type ATPase [Devosia salina]
MTLEASLPSLADGTPELLSELVRQNADGEREICFAVPDAYCATCIQSIETGLAQVPGVTGARVNLTRRQVTIRHDATADLAALGPAITRSGYRTFPVDPADVTARDPVLSELVRSLAVAGFAAGNIMLFSVSVWAGADQATRDLFHWLSALLALPAVAYAGRPFFRSAWSALRVSRTNMDVPITIGVLATTGLSLYETATSGAHAYFDASTMLLFFLLVGRTLDHMMRVRARSAVEGLSRLQPRAATRLLEDGRTQVIPLARILPGMILMLRAGDRVPVDGRLRTGPAQFDLAMVSGESHPLTLELGESLVAGAAVLDRPVEIEVLRTADQSFLSRMTEMMRAAEDVRTRYRRLADRVAALYAPVIHVTAAATLAGWLLAGASLHTALLHAVSVLIITCPCALALAVPIVHVVAAGRLFGAGILVRDGAALEKLSRVHMAAFDKTGTITQGRPQLLADPDLPPDLLRRAAWLASGSNHPLSRALVEACPDPLQFTGEITETPGAGVAAHDGIDIWRLGNADFCGAEDDVAGTGSQVWLSRNGEVLARFQFNDIPRPEATEALRILTRQGVQATMLSGDRPVAVAAIAEAVGLTSFTPSMRPDDKVVAIETLRSQHGTVLMVGDGINDAPAMRAADVSMAPGSAADIGRAAADLVMTRNRLTDVPFAIAIARRADRLVRQNLLFSVAYNVVVLPLAIAGQVSPLIAAVAMSTSSLVVVLNAMRLKFGTTQR